jgi:hypothetical protein
MRSRRMEVNMSARRVIFTVVLAASASAGVPQESKPAAPGHKMMTADEIVWGAASPALPKGASGAILAGNPAESGPFTLRLKMPPGYKIAPHWHPTTEHVTVLSGVFSMGTGDTYDASALHAIPAGGISIMPAETRHFAYTKDGAIVQVHGNGPFTLNYVNPADDPRQAAAPAK